MRYWVKLLAATILAFREGTCASARANKLLSKQTK